MESTPAAVPDDRTRTGATLAALGLLVVVAVVFLVSTPGWYFTFKAIHVVGAVVWLGGGTTLLVLALLAQMRRQRDPVEVTLIARQAAFCGERIFAPAGLLVVLSGIAMIVNGDLEWGQFWVIAGLVGYAITFSVGLGVLSPLAKRVGAATAELGPEHPETQALVDRVLLVARFDVAMLLLVVVDMVAKPFSYG